jgi:hypothetical protein
MLSPLFSLVCPVCARPIVVDGGGRAACAACQEAYLVRVGHLILDPSPRPAGGSSGGQEGSR